MQGGLAFIGFMVVMVMLVMWGNHEKYKNLNPAQTTGAACYQKAGAKGVAGCLEICTIKHPDATGQSQCRLQVVREFGQ